MVQAINRADVVVEWAERVLPLLKEWEASHRAVRAAVVADVPLAANRITAAEFALAAALRNPSSQGEGGE